MARQKQSSSFFIKSNGRKPVRVSSQTPHSRDSEQERYGVSRYAINHDHEIMNNRDYHQERYGASRYHAETY